METILIIDDEIDLVEIIKDTLEDTGFNVITAYNGFDGIQKSKEKPDLIILDIMMEDIDGFNVCYSIRDNVNCPIIFLSAKNEESAKLKALGIGGDDYITKPFSLKELVARVKVHLRREKRYKKDHEDFLRFNNINIDLKAKSVLVNGENTNLTNLEYRIVEFLALNPNQVFSRDQIYDKIWGYDGLGDSFTVIEHIKKIRSKIGENPIKTIWGIGYKWED